MEAEEVLNARTDLPALFQAASILHPGTGVGELCAQQLQAATSLHPGTGVEELCAHQSAGRKKNRYGTCGMYVCIFFYINCLMGTQLLYTCAWM